MIHSLLELLAREMSKLEQAGLLKRELLAPTDRWRDQGADMSPVINLTSHDYLGVSTLRNIPDAAKHAIDVYGVGLYSTPMACGTRSIHRELEQAIAAFLGFPAALLYTTGYQANLGLFEPLFDSRDYLFCDGVLHPSAADGVRLAGARVFSYRSNDLDDLEDKLKRSRSARFRAIVTDGVFPLDGVVADLAGVCELAETYDALVIVDDSLGVGVLGETGRGTREYARVMERVDIVTGSLSMALGGAAGGYVAASKPVVEWLRQKSVPHLFSGSLPPPLAGSASAVFDLLNKKQLPLHILKQRRENLRDRLAGRGFSILGGEHPLFAVEIGDAVTLQKMVNKLYQRSILVSGLCYPVVPEGLARIRIQISASHTEEEVGKIVEAFEATGREVGVI
jgi:glycine C-acetyltransferase